MADKKKVKEVVKTMEDFLAAGGNMQELKSVVQEFDALLEREEKQNTAIITAAYILSDQQRESIESMLNNMYRQQLDFEYIVDPEIIAGIKVKVFDEVIDMTIESALESIKASLKH